MTHAYIQGFMTKCAEYGVDGYSLLKLAQQKLLPIYDPKKHGAVDANGVWRHMGDVAQVVRKGDTVSDIMRRHGIPYGKLNDVLALNGLTMETAKKLPDGGMLALSLPGIQPAKAVSGTSSKPATSAAGATDYSKLLTPEFYRALASVESGAMGGDAAINEGEKAHGRYQIRPIYLADGNRFAGTNYTLEDMHDAAKAQQVMDAYLRHYGDAYVRNTGKPLTQEVLSRIHNGGPKGYDKSATDKYWKAVSGFLSK